MQNSIKIIVENDTDEDVPVNLFDSRQWGKKRLLSIYCSLNHLSYDDILHNLIKNDIDVEGIHIQAYKGSGFDYLIQSQYDYKRNPLNTTIDCVELDIFGEKKSYPIDIIAEKHQHQKSIVVNKKCKFKIGNLSYINYFSKAKTTVFITIFKK